MDRQRNGEISYYHRSPEPGKVKVEGGSTLRIAGEWLSVSGLHFTDGYAPKGSVIEFRNGQELANHCRLTNCVIDKFNPSRRDQAYSYILLYGRHNRVDHCSLTGKLNLGGDIDCHPQRRTLSGKSSPD
ncbi:hypothetical protein NXU97_04210 [Bacteroides xylanisolvens]|nr:hypothetical protein [Bacteroides xylanisolvens]